jgi:maltooligosyltrehalose trehalohydrolase
MDSVIRRRLAQFTDPARRVGATHVAGEGVYIRLWAPFAEEAAIEWRGAAPAPLSREEGGYFTGHFPSAAPGDRYFFHCLGRRIPDPASRFQPEGVFGPSEVVPASFAWSGPRRGAAPFGAWVIYEVHTGAFSAAHDFAGIAEDLPRLKEIGINALEIMPVSQFSGARNWGYDGVFPHAVQNSYGGPEGLKRLVDACHGHGIAVILDVVFNHVGPEGNVLFPYGPYTRDKYKTPWGDALNFDGAGSDEVRRYFLQAAWQWLTEYRFDGLRLDAVHAICDMSPVPFLEELALLKRAAEAEAGVPLALIAESDRNDSRLLAPPENHGLGMDAQWADDLHHALHSTLTGEKRGYYKDYGGADQIARIYRQGVAYDGIWSPFRQRMHGRPYDGIARNRLVAEVQNHDQIGNRRRGERLSCLAGENKVRLAAACVLLSPFTPLIFMGEELASRAPFLYFVSHEEAALVEEIREGRKKEWKAAGWEGEPPDPAAPETFERCVLHDKAPPPGSAAQAMQEYYSRLIALSKEIRRLPLTVLHKEGEDVICLHYRAPRREIAVCLSFSGAEALYALPAREGWALLLCSYDPEPAEGAPFLLSLPPFSATVFGRGAA